MSRVSTLLLVVLSSFAFTVTANHVSAACDDKCRMREFYLTGLDVGHRWFYADCLFCVLAKCEPDYENDPGADNTCTNTVLITQYWRSGTATEVCVNPNRVREATNFTNGETDWQTLSRVRICPIPGGGAGST